MFENFLAYRLSKRQKLEESFKYIATCLSSFTQTGKTTIIGITSTLPYKTSKSIISRELALYVSKMGNSVTYVDIDTPKKSYKKAIIRGENSFENFKELKAINQNFTQVWDTLQQQKEPNIIIINIPPLPLISQSIPYLKICDKVVLLERYLYTKYADYEDALIKLNTHRINLLGVVTYN